MTISKAYRQAAPSPTIKTPPSYVVIWHITYAGRTIRIPAKTAYAAKTFAGLLWGVANQDLTDCHSPEL